MGGPLHTAHPNTAENIDVDLGQIKADRVEDQCGFAERLELVRRVKFPTKSQKLIALALAVAPSALNEALALATNCDRRTVAANISMLREIALVYFDGWRFHLNVPVLRSLADGRATVAGDNRRLSLTVATVADRGRA
jgi:hypothetical protein